MFTLRQESPDDDWAVETLYDTCFAPGRQALSSYRLREGVAPVATLCLVAEESGTAGGAIRTWPVAVGGVRALLVGPVAVHPTYQGEGLGGALIRAVLDRAGDRGERRALLVGDEPYYGRFGFHRLVGVEMPRPTNPDRVLGHALVPGAWDGIRGKVTRAVSTDEGECGQLCPGRSGDAE